MAISKELKERWIARLESPEAKWAGRQLLDAETGGMCCLGHLADMQGHLEPNGIFNPPCEDEGARMEEDLCVLSVTERDGVHVIPFYGLDYSVQSALAKANDDGKAFPLDMIRALPVAEEGEA